MTIMYLFRGDLAKAIVNALNNEKLTRNREYNVAGKTKAIFISLEST